MEAQSLSAIIAFGAGLLSFVSPCILPLVPVYITHLAGQSAIGEENSDSRLSPFFHALSFVVGFSVIFIALGASVGLIGSILYTHIPLLRKIAGVLLVILGLYVAGLFKIPFLAYERRLTFSSGGVPGYVRSFVVGLAFSIGWTPCVGPILAGIFTLAWSSQTVLQGAYLLSIYSLGLGLPFLAVGLALGPATRQLKRLNRFIPVVSIVSGVLLVFIGVLILTNSLATLNQYFNFFGLGEGI